MMIHQENLHNDRKLRNLVRPDYGIFLQLLFYFIEFLALLYILF